MKLGDHVEIRTSVSDLVVALAFYKKLGFEQIANAVVTDGSLNILLLTGNSPSPTLSYAGSDIEQIKALGIPLEGDGDTTVFVDPNGLHVTLTKAKSNVPMPGGTYMTRTPISRCGKFGEFAVPCKDTQASIAYWEKLGYDKLHFAEEPYPWAILSDGLIVLGLHQTTDFAGPHITYFAGDMAERIEKLKADGITMTAVPPEVDGKVANAVFTAPGGQKIFLFHGEI
jgi:catechol 2,3-dioxygenase-like lactoylglutathione lyase family enzyme